MPTSRHSLERDLPIILGTSAVIQLVAGITWGLHGDWMRMSLLFFGGTLMAFFGVFSLTGLRLRACFKCLEDRLPRHPGQSVPARRRANYVGILMVISVPVFMSLSIITGLRHDWLKFGMCLAACGVTAVVCTGISFVLTISTRSRHLDQLVLASNIPSDFRSSE